MSPESNRRILIINIARMGDLLQSSPLIAALKRDNEEVEISMLFSEHFRDVAAAIPGIDRLIGISLHDIVSPLIVSNGGIKKPYKLLNDLAQELRSYGFDRVINITHTHYSAILTSLARGGSSAGMNLDREGFKVVNNAWANYYLNSCLNRVFNRFNLVDMHSCIGGDMPDSGRLHLIISDEARIRAQSLIRKHNRPGHKFIAVIPGASSPEKAWHPELFGQAVNRLSSRTAIIPLIFGTESEFELGRKISNAVPGTQNLCGRTDFQLLSALVERCDLMITNDTGPMHIAAAVGTRILDISLGSALSHETAPYGDGHIVVEPRIDCYPCHVKMKCSHRSCHKYISPEIIASLAETLLKGETPSHLPDDRASAKVNIMRSSFDYEGWWELIPLVRRKLTRIELLNHAMREMWKKALSGSPAWSPEYGMIAEEVGRRLNENYITDNQLIHDKTFYRPIRVIESLASTGLKASLELASKSADKSNHGRISELGDILKNVDQNLIRLAYEHPEVKPLVAQFIYGKDNLTGWELSSLARQTASLYENLVSWGRALPNWIDALGVGVSECRSSCPRHPESPLIERAMV
ncbi:glycosyltransferase family 9 protein [bacterium]|nr:glycosyltransferase family 9 protein [bacterium]